MATRPPRFRWAGPDTAPALLFCFPYAGGGASCFAPLTGGDLRTGTAVLPGRESTVGDATTSGLRELAADFAHAVVAEADRPFAVFGHSAGALLAFEVAHQLRDLGADPPLFLAVAAFPAPDRLPVLDPDADLTTALPASVRDDPETALLLLAALRADVARLATYSEPLDRPPLDIPVVAVGGADDPGVTRDDLRAWSTRGTGGSATVFPGGHFFVVEHPDPVRAHLRVVVEHLAEARLLRSAF
ncbi:thioesterase II family protein [Actinokineospora globicatena]|uniref:thioesterase II family protein n=1 Tax=Actinokineospora globicatena TaxID=103729 RepID=UPI0020A3CC71|nr:alpha/beta fold hydrolase [Actinokineospora globicatena]MCP2303054.1 Surfactin synthase thioesterase subunit [Actinokineospora globicatena]GLW79834.1 hypothetical protein Aglo01_43150 [Actinokineospora globicatena]GLW85756.1 hypothetical protein Aglo02_33960 [Actinokineospora globicatena]